MIPRLQTALWDAIYLGVNKVKEGNLDKKALLIISDGEDSSSTLKGGYESLLKHVRSNARDVTIFAVGLLEQDDQRPGGLFGRNTPSKKARAALEEIAALTGGQAFFPKSVDEVEEICRRIARDLRNQYTVGYNPKNTKLDGTWREISVVVNPPRGTPKANVRTKQGYFAPGEAQ
jgi:Ca-activated chloride channel family protein